MTYQLGWLPTAQQELASLWLVAGDRNTLSRAVHWLETALRRRPETLGEVLFDTVRRHTYGPLGVEFEVSEPDLRVTVLSVWDAETGPPDPVGH